MHAAMYCVWSHLAGVRIQQPASHNPNGERRPNNCCQRALFVVSHHACLVGSPLVSILRLGNTLQLCKKVQCEFDLQEFRWILQITCRDIYYCSFERNAAYNFRPTKLF